MNKMNSKLAFYIIFNFFLISECNSNVIIHKDTIKNKNIIKLFVAPVLYKSIETNWAFGFSSSIAFKTTNKNDSLTRTSSIQGIAMITQKNQNIQVLDATIYFPEEYFILNIQTAHSYFPDKFWGIGSNTRSFNFENYEYSQIYFLGHIKRKLIGKAFIGVLFENQNVYNLKFKKNNLFDKSIIHGKTNHNVTGLGISFCYDSRNSSFWPTKGLYLNYIYRPALKSFLNSSYTNIKSIIDIRLFKKIQSKTVLAIQLYNISNFKETPIREFAMLGGAYNLRGFHQGRFRDLKMSTLISELRYDFHKKLSACIFHGFGNVYNNLSISFIKNIKMSFGAGIRYSLLSNEKLNIRIDYGYSDKYNRGLYFTFGECF